MRKFEELKTKYLKEQQKILEVSIKNWEENVQFWRDDELDEIYVFAHAWPLCTKNRGKCKNCIISKYGKACTDLQVWMDATQRFQMDNEPDISSHKDYIDAGKALNEFLQYLRDINIEITTELTTRKYVDDSKPVKMGDYVDTIENAITDFCIENDVKSRDIPFSVFELSIHISEYFNVKDKKRI